MGLWDKLRGEFIDIIEWTEPNGSELLAYRFPRYNNEIKYGAKLTVREGQAAAFVNQGQLADVYPPGMYTLETDNMPILRSEEHTSELQSQSNLVCRLLLEKKKKKKTQQE